MIENKKNKNIGKYAQGYNLSFDSCQGDPDQPFMKGGISLCKKKSEEGNDYR
jgi:hypothetical protein